MNSKTYPRTNDFQTVYLNTVIKNPAIMVGDYTIYNDFVNDPVLFEKNNVLFSNSRIIVYMMLYFLTLPKQETF